MIFFRMHYYELKQWKSCVMIESNALYVMFLMTFLGYINTYGKNKRVKIQVQKKNVEF